MKNVIFMLVDSIYSECMGCGRTEKSSTPSIDKMADEGFYANNVYSYGPYTDAATIGLYCANPTLENYGYYFGINTAPYNHFKIFKDAGYETFGLFYPYYLISSKTKKKIDHPIYTGGFKFESVWGGKLQYYKKRKDQVGLTDLEYKLIIKCMYMVFDCWLGFYSDIQNADYSVIVSTLKDTTLCGSGLAGLKSEFEAFKKDPIAYVDNLLDLGMAHPLAKVNEFDYGKKDDKTFINEIYKKHSKELSCISKVNIKNALINSPFRINKAIKQVKEFFFSHNSDNLRYFANYGMLLFSNTMMIKRSLKQRNWQEVASLNKQIEVLIEALQKRNDTSKPFYASIHALEPHHNISYFSFDSFDHNLVDEEFGYIMSLLPCLGKDFCGNVIYQLSLRYVDLCIKRLVDNLKKLGIIDNTVIVLVSDHGSSYTFNPLRNTVVNTFHKENYNIPVMIWSQNMENNTKTDSLFMSDDILPTVMYYAGLKGNSLNGHNMVENINGRSFVITEYMGPGVPDMINREVWISARSKNYVIAYRVPINKNINLERPTLMYDLRNDPNELCSKILTDDNEIRSMKSAIYRRFMKIQANTKMFLDQLDKIVI